MVKIVGVAFKEGGKIYYFSPGEEKYSAGEGVVVETSRGQEYAKVVQGSTEIEEEKLLHPLKPVVRKATKRDDETYEKNLERSKSAFKTVEEKIRKHGLDMKLVNCEIPFEGGKMVFHYTAPARVDFRELVKELSSVFRTRIELRQIGIRDEIKLIGGLAPCGRECCCSSCMPDIKKVSIKMAKNQGLSLNPGKISGLCGRLMCCLSYEDNYYSEACRKIPKIGSEVGCPDGKGTVINVNMLKMEARVRIDDKDKDIFTYHDYPVSQLKFKRNFKPLPGESDADDEISTEMKEILKD